MGIVKIVDRSLIDDAACRCDATIRREFDQMLGGSAGPSPLDTLCVSENGESLLWHAYRRSWATSRKDLPVVDVAAAGGWSDIGTLMKCYQQADDFTLLEVMSHAKKISSSVKRAEKEKLTPKLTPALEIQNAPQCKALQGH